MPQLNLGDGSVLAGILRDNVRIDFPGLILVRDDFLALEHIAVLEELNGTQAQIHAIWDQLERWNEERILRPERVQRRREALSRTKLRGGSRARVLKRSAPAWQRRLGVPRPLAGYTVARQPRSVEWFREQLMQ